MLQHLEVENLALIKNCSLDFYSGLTCITGETGAGKSLLLTAIRALTGSKLNANLLASSETKDLKVAALFTDADKYLPRELFSKLFLEQEQNIDPNSSANIELEAADLVITRKLTKANRNKVYINNDLCSLALLKECGTYLADIHSQNEQQDLIKSEKHLEFLDQYAGEAAMSCLLQIADLFRQDLNCKKQLKHLIEDPSKREQATRKLNAMLAEIESANIKDANEFDLLMQKREKYAKIDQLLHNLQQALAALNGTIEAENACGGVEISHNLQLCANALAKSEQLSPKLADLTTICTQIQSDVNELELNIREYLRALQYQPEQLKQLDERLSLLNDLQQKYAPKTLKLQDVLLYAEKLNLKLKLLADTEIERERLLKEHNRLQAELLQRADELHAIRKEASCKLAEEIKQVAKELALPNLEFEVAFTTSDDKAISEKGYDKVEFLISANLGKPPLPLAKVASGGESSRIFLALKVILAAVYKVPLLIFDEIDQGISGLAAKQVAAALRKLSKQHQVICISHQAQIVAQADHVYTVTKSSNLALLTTESEVKELTENEILAELARLLVAQADSETGLEAAKELRQAAFSDN